MKASSIVSAKLEFARHRLHLDPTVHAHISVLLVLSKSVGRWHSGTHILTALAVDGRCR